MEYLTRLEYGDRPDPHLAVLAHAQALEELIGQLRRVVPPADETSRRSQPEAVEYIRGLLAHMTAASGQVSLPEIDLLRKYHLDSYTVAEEVEYVSDVVRDTPEFLLTVPAFLKDALAASSTVPGVAVQIVACIRGICEGVAATDRVADQPDPGAVGGRTLPTLGR